MTREAVTRTTSLINGLLPWILSIVLGVVLALGDGRYAKQEQHNRLASNTALLSNDLKHVVPMVENNSRELRDLRSTLSRLDSYMEAQRVYNSKFDQQLSLLVDRITPHAE